MKDLNKARMFRAITVDKDGKITGGGEIIPPGSPEFKMMPSQKEESKPVSVESNPAMVDAKTKEQRDTSKDARFFKVSDIKGEKDRQKLEKLKKEVRMAELKEQIMENVQSAQNQNE